MNRAKTDSAFKMSPSATYKPDSKAPYNFIPLNDKVVKAERIPEFNKYHDDRYTGYIEIEIKTLTPIYIRDTLTDKEYEDKQNKEKKKEIYINSEFFSPGGRLRIPGSSLRGMIRTLVEIITFGKFLFFENKKLFYRGVADKSSLGEEYQSHMMDKKNKEIQYKMSAGFLMKKGNKYYITPAKSFCQIEKNKASKIISTEGKQYKEFSFYKIKNGYIVVSGNMPKKHRDWFIELPEKNAKSFEILEIDIDEYRNDTLRSDKVPDLLKLAKAEDVPCFYIKYRDDKGNERVSFGHTGMFRLPYRKTIGDHVPLDLKNQEIIDIAEAIFGNEKKFASRVYFEDAYLENNSKDVLDEKFPKILSTPKPTAFQHYIEQNENNLSDFPKNLAHYNSENKIRGYKLYWHKNGENWEENNKENINKHLTQYTRIKPIKKDALFKGVIRFENLSKVELGALLFALDLPKECAHKLGLPRGSRGDSRPWSPDLPKECAHKLGLGKPLGLGSIRITPKLYLSNREKRYQTLFAEWEDKLIDQSSKINDLKKAFESYILKELGKNERSLWDLDRMKELKAMLCFVNKPPNENTEYLPLKEFKERKVLPKPTDII